MSVTEFESSVLDGLDEAALVESLAALVRVPSVGGSDAEVEVQDVCADLLREQGYDVDRWELDLDELEEDPWFPGTEAPRTEGVGVVGTSPGDGTPALILQGHLDVVPPGDPARSRYDPWDGNPHDFCTMSPDEYHTVGTPISGARARATICATREAGRRARGAITGSTTSSATNAAGTTVVGIYVGTTAERPQMGTTGLLS